MERVFVAPLALLLLLLDVVVVAIAKNERAWALPIVTPSLSSTAAQRATREMAAGLCTSDDHVAHLSLHFFEQCLECFERAGVVKRSKSHFSLPTPGLIALQRFLEWQLSSSLL